MISDLTLPYSRTRSAEPDLTRYGIEMRPHLHAPPSPLTLAELTQALSMMFRTDPVFSGPIIDRGGLSAAGESKQAFDFDDTGMGGLHNGLQTSPLPRMSCRMVLLNQIG